VTRIVERARKANFPRAVQQFERRMREAQEHSSVIRQLLLRGKKGDIAEAPIQNRDETVEYRSS
jgi:hypothetical protein